MQVSIIQKHINLTDAQKEYIQEKVENLKHLAHRVDDESTQVRVDVEHNNSKTTNKNISLQVTMVVPHAVVRAEVMAITPEEAIDLATDKLKKQIERYKGKQHRRDQSGKWIPSSTLEEISSTQELGTPVSKITKRKTFSEIKVMHEEEAVEQMELLEHDFFAFLNVDTGKFNVVYKRKDDTYGLIDLENK